MGTVVYRDATIFDGTGPRPAAGRSLVVDDERIAQVVATGAAASCPTAPRSSTSTGRFVIPGLIDSHQHLATPPDRAAGRGLAAPDGVRRRHGDPRHGRRPAPDRRPRPRLPGRRDPRSGHPLRRPDGRPELLRRPAHLAGLPGRDARRRCRGCRRSPTRPTCVIATALARGHARQRDQDLRRPVGRPGRRDRRRRRTGRACRRGRTCRSSRRCRWTSCARASTSSRTSRCWPGRPRRRRRRRTRASRRSTRPRSTPTTPGSPRCSTPCSSTARSSTRPRACGRATRCSRAPTPTRSPGRRATPSCPPR